MKKDFNELTDIVEHAQASKAVEGTNSSQKDRVVEDFEGEKVILGENISSERF